LRGRLQNNGFLKPAAPAPPITAGPGFFITITKRTTTMKTYQFTAFRDERFAANGEEPDHFTLTDEAGEEHDLWEEMPPDVLKALKTLIQKADDLIAAIDGTTGQFEAEVSALSEATSAAEKAMRAAGGAS
jgi:hypothetical protein